MEPVPDEISLKEETRIVFDEGKRETYVRLRGSKLSPEMLAYLQEVAKLRVLLRPTLIGRRL